jgi:hypothetical protein
MDWKNPSEVGKALYVLMHGQNVERPMASLAAALVEVTEHGWTDPLTEELKPALAELVGAARAVLSLTSTQKVVQ